MRRRKYFRRKRKFSLSERQSFKKGFRKALRIRLRKRRYK